MTVRRQGHDEFSASPEMIAIRIRVILQNGPQYSAITEDKSGCSFQVSVQHRPTQLPTQMYIKIEEKNVTSVVSVSIKSQWFIIGDVFGYYNRYISEFLTELKLAKLPSGEPVTPALPLSSQRSIGPFASVLLLFTSAFFMVVATVFLVISYYVETFYWREVAIVTILYVKGAFVLLLFIRLRSKIHSNLFLLASEWRVLAAGCSLAATMFTIAGITGEGSLIWLAGLPYAAFAAACWIAANHAIVSAA